VKVWAALEGARQKDLRTKQGYRRKARGKVWQKRQASVEICAPDELRTIEAIGSVEPEFRVERNAPGVVA
jgi:hypothetical protein